MAPLPFGAEKETVKHRATEKRVALRAVTTFIKNEINFVERVSSCATRRRNSPRFWALARKRAVYAAVCNNRWRKSLPAQGHFCPGQE
jgi:hypothetical protein